MIDCLAVPVATPAQANAAEAQLRLSMIGYSLVVDGAAGPKTRAAVRSWETRNGMRADGLVSPTDLRRLRGQSRGSYSVRVDLSDQTLTVTRGRSSVTIPVSTGKPSTPTPVGSFTVQRRIDGMRQSRLGCLQRPLYFDGYGRAIHGSNSVPRNKPSSASCVRVSMPAIEALFRTVANGARVVVGR